MQSRDKRLIFEMSKKGRRTPIIGDAPDGWSDGIPNHILRDDELPLPYVSEPEVIRHYTGLSAMNYGVDTGSYPLGSCTMKYNPKIRHKSFYHTDRTGTGTASAMGCRKCLMKI